jgi:hypothetical protein
MEFCTIIIHWQDFISPFSRFNPTSKNAAHLGKKKLFEMPDSYTFEHI